MMRRTLPVLAVVLALAGCGDRPGYDASAVEAYLVHSQLASFPPSAEISRATCPADLSLHETMRLACTLTVSGSKVPYRVRLTHVHDERVHIDARVDGVLISGVGLRHHVRATLPKTAAGADVDCGGDYVVAAIGSDLDCTMSLGSQRAEVKVRILDADGRVSLAS